MRNVKSWPAVFAIVLCGLSPARAQHACDPAPPGGWRVEPSLEVTGVTDGAPYRSDVDWMLDRTTTLLPMCNYFSPVGSYSLKSYSLDPVQKVERVLLCHGNAQGVSVPVSPWPGPCPPK
jgi:hypothetical protein